MAYYLDLFVDPATSGNPSSSYAGIISYTEGTWKLLLYRDSNFPMPPTGYSGRLFRTPNGYFYYSFTPATAARYNFHGYVIKNSSIISTSGAGYETTDFITVDGTRYFLDRVSALGIGSYGVTNPVYTFDVLPSNDLTDAIRTVWGIPKYPITYRLTNASASSAPTEAAIGDTVNASFAFPSGYGIANSNNVYVMNNGVIIPSTYSNGTLTFTMPDPT